MLESGSGIHVRFSDDSGEHAIRGAVVTSTACELVFETQEWIELPVDARVEVLCRLKYKFVRAQATVQAILRQEPPILIRLTWIGQPHPCEVRSTFRVSVPGSKLNAMIGTDSVWLVDVSFNGFSIWSLESYENGSVVEVTLYYGGQRFTGKARVRNVNTLGEGRKRYGLSITEDSIELKRGLQQITMGIQRQQLRNLAGYHK